MRLYAVLMAGVQVATCSENALLTVCDVLQNLSAYKGQRISIRGRLVGTGHGLYLSAEKCKKPLVVSGFKWPRSLAKIHLIQPGTSDEEEPSSAPYHLWIDPALDKPSSPCLAGAEEGTWVTAVGRLETRTKFEMVLWGKGKVFPYGYGHLNTSPAQLFYEELRDVRCLEKTKGKTAKP